MEIKESRQGKWCEDKIKEINEGTKLRKSNKRKEDMNRATIHLSEFQ